MKHFLMIIAMLVFALGTGFETAAEDRYSQKELDKFRKEAEKQAKASVKGLQGWECSSVLTLQSTITHHLLSTKPFGGNYVSKNFSIDKAKSLSLGRSRLLLEAQREITQQNKLALGGRIGLDTNDASGLEAMETEIGGNIAGELKGDIQLDYVIYKRNRDGSYEMRGFFLYDEDNSTRNVERLAEEIKKNRELLDRIHKSSPAEGE